MHRYMSNLYTMVQLIDNKYGLDKLETTIISQQSKLLKGKIFQATLPFRQALRKSSNSKDACRTWACCDNATEYRSAL
jgi:hypothetical protein